MLVRWQAENCQSEVLALLHPSDEDIFDDDIHEPVQKDSDEEFDDSEDDDFTVDGCDGTGGEEIVQDSDEEEMIEDSDEDRLSLLNHPK